MTAKFFPKIELSWALLGLNLGPSDNNDFFLWPNIFFGASVPNDIFFFNRFFLNRLIYPARFAAFWLFKDPLHFSGLFPPSNF